MRNQQDLLSAQVEEAKLLCETTMHHLEVAKAQAQSKELLNRPQSWPDIEPSDLPDNPTSYTFDEFLSATNSETRYFRRTADDRETKASSESRAQGLLP